MVGRQFSPQRQRYFMVDTFIETYSVARTGKRFTQRFHNIPIAIPCRYTVRRNLRKYMYHSPCISQNLNGGRSGRFRSERSSSIPTINLTHAGQQDEIMVIYRQQSLTG